MKFPVDLLADVSQAELERLAHNYMNNLLYSNPDSPEHLTLSDSTQVTIDISSVGFVPLYGSSDKQKILALFSPSDPFTAVALYLLDQWWAVDDILKTADPARDGALGVETVGERIVLYILNRVIYRVKEMSSEELPFLCHGEKDNAKILWNNGEAVGFYSVKPSGSLCSYFSTRSYQLPVMDSIFVRKCQRGKGFGLQMLEDFVLSFKEDCLGLRYPLTKSMYKVCEKYLCQYPGDTDLLWEVESIGGPNQRTNIASKIQAMDLSAVSKSLGASFTEESLITAVTEKDVVMEAVTTQIKEAESMECTVEIVEEVTVLRATRVSEPELPVAARGRSSGSKQRKMGAKITEDKSEKVIRIEDIEAETPREEQVSVQQKTELHKVSELVQTEAMFSVALEEKGQDVVDTAPEDAAATMSDKPATVLASQDLEEADVTSTLTTEVPQVEDDATQDLNNTSHDLQITVENVASEIEEAEEECQKEDTAMLVESVEVLEVHKEAETLDKVGEATQIEVTDEKSEERVTQRVVSLSTHATSEDGEAGKTGKTVVKAIKTAQSETHRRRSQWHSKPEEGVKKETTAQDGGRVLRGRTCMTTPTPKCKYTQHSQKVCEELEKEVDEVAGNEVSTTEVVEEFALNEGEEPEENTTTKEDVVAVEKLRQKRQLEDEQLTNEEEIEKQEEPGVEDTVMKGSFTELPGTTDGSEKEPKGDEVETSVIQYKQEVSDDEIEEPPVVQKRALRARRKVTPKPMPAKQSKRQEEEYTEEADLGAGSSASEEKADEQTTDEQMEEHHQVEQEETVDKTEEEISTEELTVGGKGTIPKAEEAAENVIPQSEVNVEESKVVQKEEETKGETENVSLMEVDKDEEADDMIQEPDTVAAATETVIPDEVLDEAATLVAEENQEKAIGSKIPKLQKATVILVDLKTTCHHLSVKEAEETPVDEECVAPEKEQMELTAAEEKDVSSCIAEEQTPVTETLVLEEEDRGEKQYSTDKSVDAIAEADTAKKEELEECRSDQEKEEPGNVDEEQNEAEESPVIETRVLRSGIKTVEASCKSTSRSNQQQEEDHIDEGITEKEVDETETGIVEVEGEIKAMAKDAVTVTVPVEEKQFASVSAHIPETTDIPVVDDAEENLQPAEVDEAMSLGEEEAPVAETRALRSGTKTVTATPRHKKTRTRTQEDEQDAENSDEEEPAVTTRTLRRGRISASATPKAKSRRTRKQINKQEEEQMGEEESQSVEKMGEVDGEPFKEAAVEKTDKEMEENIEEETGEKVKEEAAFEREECLESEIDVEEGKAVAEEGQDVVEEQSEAISKTFAEREVETSGKECDERKPVIGGEEVELPSVAVTRSLRSCGKTSKASPKTKSKKQQDEEKEEGWASAEKSSDGDEPPAESRILRRGRKSLCRNHKQLQKEEEGPKELAEEADVEEEEEAGLGSAEQPPTEGERVVGKAPEEDKIEAEKEELVTVEVEKEERIMTEEEENTAGVTAAADHLVQDSAILTASKEEATPSGEVRQSEEMAPQLSDLQSLTVVLVDLEKPDHEVTMKAEETMAEEHVPGSSVGIEKTELEKMVGFEEKVDDAVTIQYTEEGRAVETAKEDVAESVDDEKGEPVVTKTRTQRSRKQAVKATPRHKLERSRQKKGEEEKEEASEIIEAEPAVQVRVLRRGRKPIPASQRCPTKRTHKQLQEEAEKGGEESTAIEAREAEEEDKQAEEQQLMIDQDKGERLEEKDATQQVENIEPEIGVEKEDTVTDEAVIQQDAPEEGQASSTETVANENPEAPVGQSADEGKTSDDVAEEAVTTQDTVERKQSASTSEVEETTAGESAQVTLLTAKDDEAKGASVEKEAPVIEPRVLRSGEKTMRAITKSKTKKKKDEQEKEATGEKSTEGDESTVETRVLRKGRSAASTHWRKSKRARTQFQTEEEGEDKTTPAEEMQVEETKAMLEEAEEKQERTDEKIEESNEEEAAAQKEEKTEPGLVEMEKVEAVAEESLTEQETVEEEQSAVLETCADRHGEASIRESVEKTPNTDEGKVPGEEEAPTLETRVLRNGRKAVKATPRSKSTKSQQEENEEEATVVEKGADKDEPAVETRVLRKGRRSASATPRRKSKRARTQCQLEEEGEEENTPAEETEGEEEEAGQELPEEKGEKAEEEGKSLEIEVKKEKDVEEEEVESAEGGESAVGDAEQMKVATTEEAAGFEKEDNSVTAVDEPGTDMVKISSAEVEETNSAEEEETTVIEKSTADTEVGSDTVIAEEVALVKDASVVAEEEAPAVTRTLRKTQSSRRSRRQKDQGVVETQQQEEENLEHEGTQEVHQLTDESPENRELNAKEQAETVETSPTGQGAGPPSVDTAEDQTKETADLIDDRVVESAGEEPATEEMKLPEEELSENKDKTVDSSVVQGRRLRRRMEADAEEEKAEEIQLPERRSIRKRPRVDYSESYEDEGGETEAATDKEEEDKVGSDEDKDNKKAECSTDELIEKLEESSREENLENNMGAIESTSEKGDVLNLVLDTDEEVKTAVISQEDMEDEQNVSEEDVEPIVIGKRVLRGRSVPSVIFTPQSKSRRRSAKVQKAEESV